MSFAAPGMPSESFLLRGCGKSCTLYGVRRSVIECLTRYSFTNRPAKTRSILLAETRFHALQLSLVRVLRAKDEVAQEDRQNRARRNGERAGI